MHQGEGNAKILWPGKLVLLTSRDGSHLNQNATNPAGPSQTNGMNAIAGRPAGSNSGSRVLGRSKAKDPG
jgi:hypothetical protein